MGLDSTHYFIMKVPNKRDLQQTVFNHSSDIGIQYIQYLMNLYKKCATNKHSVIIINGPLASDNPLRFRKNLLERI